MTWPKHSRRIDPVSLVRQSRSAKVRSVQWACPECPWRAIGVSESTLDITRKHQKGRAFAGTAPEQLEQPSAADARNQQRRSQRGIFVDFSMIIYVPRSR